MRRIACGLIVGCVCSAAAGGIINTIVSSDTPVAGAPGDASLISIRQVVLEDTGGVAISTSFDISLDAPAILYRPTAGPLSTIARIGQPVFGLNPGTFNQFANLSTAGGKVSFTAANGSNQYGLFRYDSGVGSAILFEGGPVNTPSGSLASSLDTASAANFQFMPYGLNPSGKLSFGAVTTPAASGTQMLARFDGVGNASRTLNNGDASLTNFNTNPSSFLLYKKVITASDATVFMAQDSSSPRRIYGLDPAPGSLPVPRISAVYSAGGFEYRPIQLMAATGSAAFGVTAYAAHKSDPLNPSFSQDALLASNGSSTIELGAFNLSTIPTQLQFEANLEMSGDNRIAAYIPTAAGGKVVYWDPLAGLMEVATAGSSVLGENEESFTIDNITITQTSVPMINRTGLVVFDAGIDTNGAAAGGLEHALLVWDPTQSQPRVVIRSGDVVTIAGQPRTITSLIPAEVDGSMGYDSDVLKDGLADTGLLAFGATYARPGDSDGYAVLSTYVPEPAAALLMLMALLLPLARNQRNTRNTQKRTAAWGRASRAAVGGESENRVIV